MLSSKISQAKKYVAMQSSIEIKTDSELKKLKEAGRLVSKVLKKVGENLKSGISTKSLDNIAFAEIRSLKIKPAFLGYRGFPATACISINDELVHGIPRKDRIIKDGDIVTVDVGVNCDGYFGDIAATFAVGRISPKAQKLIEITRRSLDIAVGELKPGKRLGDMSWAVQNFVEKSGFAVVRDYVGHGIGRKLHEDPAVPNFGQPGTGVRLVAGMVLAVEPMVTEGDWKVRTLSDDWTVVTVDGKLCAHFEHMIAITENGCEVLTEI